MFRGVCRVELAAGLARSLTGYDGFFRSFTNSSVLIPSLPPFPCRSSRALAEKRGRARDRREAGTRAVDGSAGVGQPSPSLARHPKPNSKPEAKRNPNAPRRAKASARPPARLLRPGRSPGKNRWSPARAPRSAPSPAIWLPAGRERSGDRARREPGDRAALSPLPGKTRTPLASVRRQLPADRSGRWRARNVCAPFLPPRPPPFCPRRGGAPAPLGKARAWPRPPSPPNSPSSPCSPVTLTSGAPARPRAARLPCDSVCLAVCMAGSL